MLPCLPTKWFANLTITSSMVHRTSYIERAMGP